MEHIHTGTREHNFSVSAFVLHPTEKKILLIEHKKLPVYLQSGGHVEKNEDPWEALSHELLEEAGLDITKCRLLLQPDQPTLSKTGYKTLPIPFHQMSHYFDEDGEHRHNDMSFAIRSYTAEIAPQQGESQKWLWVDVQLLDKLKSEGSIFDSTYTILNWLFAKEGLWQSSLK